MSKAYRHIPMARDEYLGRVEPDGKVYESRFGPDRYIGRVDPITGKIYESRLGPDKEIGHVDVKEGKVYHLRLGPDKYLGWVREDGKCYWHKPLARDDYMGRVEDMLSYAHGGAAFLLLIMPAIEEVKEEETRSELEKGSAADDVPPVAPEQA